MSTQAYHYKFLEKIDVLDAEVALHVRRVECMSCCDCREGGL